MPKAILDKLPDKAKDIYEAAWQQAIEDSRDEESAAKIAIAAVKRAGYTKDEDTGQWHKMHFVEMHITKATLGGDGVMRWAGTVSKFGVDDQGDEVTPEFYQYAAEQVQSGKRPDPVLCISHIDKGKPSDSWVPGDVTDLYIDGERPKAKGTFRDTPLGRKTFESVRNDYGQPDDEKIRISLGFYNEGSQPIQAKSGAVTGQRFFKGWIKHLALTRVPVVAETNIEILEAKAMKTKKEDAASIVGAELAEELVREDKAELDDGLVLKSEGEGESDAAPAEKTETEDGKEKSVSLDEFRERIYSAWRAQFGEDGMGAIALKDESWVREVMDDAVIVSHNGKYMRVPYIVDGSTGNIQFGTPVQVQEIRQFVPAPSGDSPGVTAVPHIATKAYESERHNQAMDLLMQLASLLGVEWSIDTEMANSAAMGNRGTNPPHADPAEKSETESDPGSEQNVVTDVTTSEGKIKSKSPPSPREVEIAAYVDSWAMQVKAALLSDGDRKEKFTALQQLLNSFGEGVQALVKEGTPPSGRDIADVVSDAVRAAVEPLQHQLAGVKAELDDLRTKATTLGQETPVAPRPQSLDQKARVIQPNLQQSTGPTKKARTAQELAWLSTKEGPGY